MKNKKLASLTVAVVIISTLTLSVPVGAYVQTFMFGPMIAQDSGNPPPSGGEGGGQGPRMDQGQMMGPGPNGGGGQGQMGQDNRPMQGPGANFMPSNDGKEFESMQGGFGPNNQGPNNMKYDNRPMQGQDGNFQSQPYKPMMQQGQFDDKKSQEFQKQQYQPMTQDSTSKPCNGRWIQDDKGGYCEQMKPSAENYPNQNQTSDQSQNFNQNGDQQNFDNQQNQMDEKQIKMEMKNIQNQTKNFLREITRMSKEVDKMAKKSKGMTCPVIDEAKAVLGEAKTAIADLQGATATTRDELDALRTKFENIVGGPNSEEEESLMDKMSQVMPRMGVCEGLMKFTKEVKRFDKEVVREIAKAKKNKMPDDIINSMQDVLNQLLALEKNPTEGLSEEDMADGNFIDSLFNDTLQPLRDSMDAIRESMNDVYDKIGMCKGLKSNKKSVDALPKKVSKMGEEAVAAAEEMKALFAEGLGACEAKNYDALDEIMPKIEELKNTFEELYKK
ncbi:MAG: hypothetical protein WCT36_01305 [Candidatus Gracilibacteria bacterium]